MRRLLRTHSDDLLVALAVWLCTLPLLALVVVPRLGLLAGGAAALLSLIGLLAFCSFMFDRRPSRG